jgi:hypothetical protein
MGGVIPYKEFCIKISELANVNYFNFWLIREVKMLEFFLSYKFPYTYKVRTARLEKIWS